MQVYRLNTYQALQAGDLSGGVTIDTITNVSPTLEPAIQPSANLSKLGSLTGPQVFNNVGGILNTSTGTWAQFTATGGHTNVAQVWQLTFSAAAAGTFTLSLPGYNSIGPITFNSAGSTMQTAINAAFTTAPWPSTATVTAGALTGTGPWTMNLTAAGLLLDQLLPNFTTTNPTTAGTLSCAIITPGAAVAGVMTSSENLDTIVFNVPAVCVLAQVQLVGMLQAGMGFKSGDKPDGTHVLSSAGLRNGARISVAIDAQAPVVYDTRNQTLVVNVYLDGLSTHTITLKHTGFYDSPATLIGTPKVGVGTSFSGRVTVLPSTLQTPPSAANSLIGATWTLKATSATQYSLSKTPLYGSLTPVSTLLNTGTTYDSTSVGAGAAGVPGVAVKVSTGANLTVNDTVTFTTDPVQTNLESITLFSTSGNAAGLYTTAIIDSGSPSTQWHTYEETDALFANGTSISSLSITTSNQLNSFYVTPPGGGAPPAGPSRAPQAYAINANKDPITNGGALTYSTLVNGATLSLTQNGVQLPSTGEHRTAAGLMNSAVGQYAQFAIQLTVNTQGTTAWVRSMKAYAWIPTSAGHPLFLGKLGMPQNWVPGPIFQAYFGSLLTFVADYFANANDLVSSLNYSTAVGQYLLNKGQDVGQPHITGEPQSSYQNRLTSFIQAKSATPQLTAITTTGSGTAQSPLSTGVGGNSIVSPVNGEQGSVTFIAQQLSDVVNGAAFPVTLSVNLPNGLATATCGGVTVAQLAGRGVSITLPNPPYPGLPGLPYGTTGGQDNAAKVLLKQFALSLIPAGTLFSTSSSTYLSFGPLG